MDKKKAQAATEYLLLVGFVFLIMIVSLYSIFNYGQSSFDDLTQGQLTKICQDIADTAETTYYMGEPAWQTIDVNFPNGVRNMEIVSNDPVTGCKSCTEIRFSILRDQMLDKVICSSTVKIVGYIENRSYSPGIKKIKIEARKNYTYINMTS